jgi:hypothetical protein
MAQVIALHELLQPLAPLEPLAPPSRDWRFTAQMYKTSMCRYYTRRGGCRRGAACAFAHGVGESRVAPDLTKTSLCSAWKSRTCSRAARDCPFAHGFTDLRTTQCFRSHKLLEPKELKVRKVRDEEARKGSVPMRAQRTQRTQRTQRLSAQAACDLVRWASEDVQSRGDALRGDSMAAVLLESLPTHYED